jgi:DNA-binding transcriptional LysR family regulator
MAGRAKPEKPSGPSGPPAAGLPRERRPVRGGDLTIGRLPPAARDGLMRAWLAVLRERHPEVVWVPRTSDGQQDETGDAKLEP